MSSSTSPVSNQPNTPSALVVEDESLVAMLLEDMLCEIGCAPVQVVAQLDEALQVAQSQLFSFAILDVDLAGKSSLPIADVLSKRGIPFFFSSGYGADAAGDRHANVMTLQKPFRLSDLKAAIAGLALSDAPPGVSA